VAVSYPRVAMASASGLGIGSDEKSDMKPRCYSTPRANREAFFPNPLRITDLFLRSLGVAVTRIDLSSEAPTLHRHRRPNPAKPPHRVWSR
jgi:hypothetical protein